MSRYVKIITLGCPKNMVDSRQIMSSLVKEGFIITEDISKAGIIIINTCGFIEDAKRESIDTILEMTKMKEEGNCEYLIVVGCLVQKYNKELAKEIPEIDIMLGTGDISALSGLLKSINPGQRTCLVGSPEQFLYNEDLPIVLGEVKHYAYLKIAEGCNNRCSYCIIPSLRGSYRSRSMENIIKEAETLVKEGVKEIILIAQDTTYYGIDLYKKRMLPELLKELVKISGLEWIRMLYSYPDNISEKLLQTIKEEEKICKYLDLPLQHVSDNILKAMGRTSGKVQTIKLIEKIRAYVPDITLRTTFIVGFPGETQEDFNELLAFLQETGFDRAGFFVYSREPDTKAAGLSRQINKKEKLRRLKIASELQNEILAAKQASLIGKTICIIVDGPSLDYEGLWEGRTRGDAPEIDGVVYLNPKHDTKPGDILNVNITHSQEFAIIGEIKS